MKKLLSIIASLSLVFTLAACGKEETPEKPVEQMTSAEVVYDLFNQTGLKLFNNFSILDADRASASLTNSFDPNATPLEISNFVDGVIAKDGGMILSTNMVSVIRVSDDSNKDELLAGIENLKSSGVCVRPDDKYVHTAYNSGYVLYVVNVGINEDGTETDNGLAIVEAFEKMNFEKKAIPNNTAFERALNYYITHLDEGFTSLIPAYNPSNEIGYDLTSEQVSELVYLATEQNYTKDEEGNMIPNTEKVYIVAKPTPGNEKVLHEALLKAVNEGTVGMYTFNNGKVASQEGFEIVTNLNIA